MPLISLSSGGGVCAACVAVCFLHLVSLRSMSDGYQLLEHFSFCKILNTVEVHPDLGPIRHLRGKNLLEGAAGNCCTRKRKDIRVEESRKQLEECWKCSGPLVHARANDEPKLVSVPQDDILEHVI